MVAKEQARINALKIIAELQKKSAYPLVILEDAVREYEYAWVFPFSSEKYNETRNVKDALLGFGPIVVKRSTGEAQMAPPIQLATFLDYYITAEDRMQVDKTRSGDE